MTLIARRIGLALLAASAAWLAVSALAAHLVSRRPRAPYDEPLTAVEWAAVEPVALEAADGARVRGHAFVAGTADRTVVLLHMNQADRGAMEPAAQIWAELGWSSIAISLRGHGDAEGERLDYGLVARQDAAAAVAWARKVRRPSRRPRRFPGRGRSAARCGVRRHARGRIRARSALHLDRRRDPRQDRHAAPTGARPPGSFESPRSRAAVPPWSHRERPAPRSAIDLARDSRPSTRQHHRSARSAREGAPIPGGAQRRAPEIAAVAHAAGIEADLLEPALGRWVEASGL